MNPIEQNRQVKIIERATTRLKLKQLRLLVAIAEHSSIMRAAQDIHLSQSAATKLLQDLEADFDIKLFDRTNRGVVPTVFGSTLVKHGKLILAQISHAAQELDDLNEGRGGRVVVGTLLTASARLLPRVIKHIHEQRPNVSIVVRDGTNDFLMPLLRAGDLDMVVGRLPEYRYREELTQEVLYHEKIIVVCRKNHPLSKRKNIPLDELLTHHWILPPVQTTLRRQVEKEFIDLGLATPFNPVECVSFLTNRAVLLETDMIGVFPFHVVQREIDNGEFTMIKCELNFSDGPVGVSFRNEDALSPTAKEFLSRIRLCAQELAKD